MIFFGLLTILAPIDWVIMAAYFVLTIVIGLWFTGQASKNLNAFFLGGRNLPWYLAGISMVATTFAADTPLAVTELVAKNGISGNWLWWNMMASGMLTTFFFAKLWRRAEVLTEVELIEMRYSGEPAAFLRGFKALYLGLFMNCLIIGWVNLALVAILQVFFDLSLQDALFWTAAAMAFTAVYSSLSGLIGVAITDAFQFVIAMVGCVVLAYLVIYSEPIGGMQGLKSKVPEWSLHFFPTIGTTNNMGNTLTISVCTFLAYAGVQWWASWYPGAEPGGGGYIAQRMMSAKDEKNAVYATLFFQIAHYCIRPWPWILVGLATLVLYPDLPEADKKLGYVMAMKQFLPDGLRGMLLVAFFAAYMSTISTQLNWGASYLVNDLYKRFIRKEADDKELILAARVTTIALMMVGLFVSTIIESISGVWSFIIECGAGLGLVLILRWYWWRINAWSEIVATIAPFIGYAICKWVLHVEFPLSLFITVGITTVAWIVATFATAPTDFDTLKRFVQKVKPDGYWLPITQQLNLEDKNPKTLSNTRYLFVCWISALTMNYAMLFGSGKLLFAEWNSAFIFLGIAAVSFAILRQALKKTDVLN